MPTTRKFSNVVRGPLRRIKRNLWRDLKGTDEVTVTRIFADGSEETHIANRADMVDATFDALAFVREMIREEKDKLLLIGVMAASAGVLARHICCHEILYDLAHTVSHHLC